MKRRKQQTQPAATGTHFLRCHSTRSRSSVVHRTGCDLRLPRFSQGEGGIDAVKTSLSAYDDLNALQQKLLADLSYPVAVLNGEAHPFSKALQLIRGEAMQTQSPGIKPVEKPHITGSIDYPAGITKQQAQQALSASDTFLNEALEMLGACHSGSGRPTAVCKEPTRNECNDRPGTRRGLYAAGFAY